MIFYDSPDDRSNSCIKIPSYERYTALVPSAYINTLMTIGISLDLNEVIAIEGATGPNAHIDVLNSLNNPNWSNKSRMYQIMISSINNPQSRPISYITFSYSNSRSMVRNLYNPVRGHLYGSLLGTDVVSGLLDHKIKEANVIDNYNYINNVFSKPSVYKAEYALSGRWSGTTRTSSSIGSGFTIGTDIYQLTCGGSYIGTYAKIITGNNEDDCYFKFIGKRDTYSQRVFNEVYFNWNYMGEYDIVQTSGVFKMLTPDIINDNYIGTISGELNNDSITFNYISAEQTQLSLYYQPVLSRYSNYNHAYSELLGTGNLDLATNQNNYYGWRNNCSFSPRFENCTSGLTQYISIDPQSYSIVV